LPAEKLRWIAFSHVQADECGAMNELLAIAPHARPLCSAVARGLIAVGGGPEREVARYPPDHAAFAG
jgi:flavorubredoxin